MKKYLGNKLAISLFILPAVAVFTIFVFYPIVKAVIYSFSEWDGINAAVFNGFDNYKRLFTQDMDFVLANKNQLIFAVFITIYQMFFATLFAITVSDKKIKCRKFFRVAYFIPVVLSVTVVCQLWLSVFNADKGLLNSIFKNLGSTFHQNWLGDGKTAIYVIAFVNAWQWMGYQFALIVAGIKSIPADYYEAAVIDGATNVKAHIKITIPLLAETYKFCLIISITGGIKAFTEMFVMTKGGPGSSTYTLTYIMYGAAFRAQEYGYGLAAAVVMVLECLMVMLLINGLFEQKVGRFEKKSARKRKKIEQYVEKKSVKLNGKGVR